MHVRIFGGLKVATKKERFDALEKRWISGHYVYEKPMFRAGLTHDDLAVIFHNLGFDFSRMFIHQRFERGGALNHRRAHFFNAARTKRICLSGKTQRRRRTFVGFQQRARRPLWPNRLAFGQPLVDGLKSFPGDVGERRNQLGTSGAAQFGLI